MTLAEKNMKAAFDHARKLIHAKDVQEVMQLQADFLRTQFAAAGEQMKELSTRGVSAAKDASKSTPNNMIGHESDINSLSTERAQQRKCVLVLPTEAA